MFDEGLYYWYLILFRNPSNTSSINNNNTDSGTDHSWIGQSNNGEPSSPTNEEPEPLKFHRDKRPLYQDLPCKYYLYISTNYLDEVITVTDGDVPEYDSEKTDGA